MAAKGRVVAFRPSGGVELAMSQRKGLTWVLYGTEWRFWSR